MNLPHAPGRDSLKSLASLLCLFLFILLAVSQQSAPARGPASLPAAEFSSERAMGHLRAITREPHPVGSRAAADVRDYIVRELSAAGVEVNVQESVVAEQERNFLRAATVRNVAGRMAGTGGGGKAVLLASHYDSAPMSYGAGDDGSAVAAMLETVRALRASPPLKNDVIFLFTDGEEAGLLGAKAFVGEHPWFRDAGLVLNFEARGHRGPSIMFETGPQNGRLIEEFAAAAPRPFANSFAYEVYRRLPNDTDFTVFKRAGVPGLNFAFIEGVTHYHTPLDNYANTSESSVQHHGSYALALARHFGNLSLDGPRRASSVYFDLFGRTLVNYSAGWAVLFTIAGAALFGVAVALGFRRGLLSLPKILLAFLVFLLSIAAAALVVTAVGWLVMRLHAGYQSMAAGVPYNGRLYILSFVALAVATTLTLLNLSGRRIGKSDMAIGALAWWLILAVVTTLYAQGLSYLFTWPLLLSLAGLCYELYARREEGGATGPLVVHTLGAVVGAVLLTQAIYQISVAFPLMMAGVVAVFVALTVGVLTPYLNALTDSSRRAITLVSLAAAACLLAAGSLTSGFDGARPRPNSIFYGLNADSGKAVWASGDNGPDAWTSQFLKGGTERGPLPDFLPLASIRFLHGEAPAAPLPAPELTLVGEEASEGARTLRLRVASTRQAPVISLYVDGGAVIRAVSINGRLVNAPPEPPDAGRPWALRYFAPPAEGFELSLEVNPARPLNIKAVDQTYELPQFQAAPYRARPEAMTAGPQSFSNSTFVARSFTF